MPTLQRRRGPCRVQVFKGTNLEMINNKINNRVLKHKLKSKDIQSSVQGKLHNHVKKDSFNCHYEGGIRK